MSDSKHKTPEDESLDALLAGARWPAMPPVAMRRLEARADELLRPRPRLGFRSAAVVMMGLAAGLAAGVALWLMLPDRSLEQGPIAGQPFVPELPEPALRPAVLAHEAPGRAPTAIELAWVVAIRQPDRPASPPTPAQIRRQAALERVLARSNLVPPAPAQDDPIELPPMSVAAVLADIESGQIARGQLQEVVRAIPVSLIHARVLSPESNRPPLLEAMARSPDPAAARFFLALNQEQPALARQAVANAPESAPAIFSLVSTLQSNQIAHREAAAELLAHSQDDSVYQAVFGHLAQPALRREALMALMMSTSDTARALVIQAENHPHLRAAVLSLRAQGIAPHDDPRPQASLL